MIFSTPVRNAALSLLVASVLVACGKKQSIPEPSAQAETTKTLTVFVPKEVKPAQSIPNSYRLSVDASMLVIQAAKPGHKLVPLEVQTTAKVISGFPFKCQASELPGEVLCKANIKTAFGHQEVFLSYLKDKEGNWGLLGADLRNI